MDPTARRLPWRVTGGMRRWAWCPGAGRRRARRGRQQQGGRQRQVALKARLRRRQRQEGRSRRPAVGGGGGRQGSEYRLGARWGAHGGKGGCSLGGHHWGRGCGLILAGIVCSPLLPVYICCTKFVPAPPAQARDAGSRGVLSGRGGTATSRDLHNPRCPACRQALVAVLGRIHLRLIRGCILGCSSPLGGERREARRGDHHPRRPAH